MHMPARSLGQAEALWNALLRSPGSQVPPNLDQGLDDHAPQMQLGSCAPHAADPPQQLARYGANSRISGKGPGPPDEITSPAGAGNGKTRQMNCAAGFSRRHGSTADDASLAKSNDTGTSTGQLTSRTEPVALATHAASPAATGFQTDPAAASAVLEAADLDRRHELSSRSICSAAAYNKSDPGSHPVTATGSGQITRPGLRNDCTGPAAASTQPASFLGTAGLELDETALGTTGPSSQHGSGMPSLGQGVASPQHGLADDRAPGFEAAHTCIAPGLAAGDLEAEGMGSIVSLANGEIKGSPGLAAHASDGSEKWHGETARTGRPLREGTFDEDGGARSFQDAVLAWRMGASSAATLSSDTAAAGSAGGTAAEFRDNAAASSTMQPSMHGVPTSSQRAPAMSGPSLLEGCFDEEGGTSSFQDAVLAWRRQGSGAAASSPAVPAAAIGMSPGSSSMAAAPWQQSHPSWQQPHGSSPMPSVHDMAGNCRQLLEAAAAGSLLEGSFDEAGGSKSFQEAVAAWRGGSSPAAKSSVPTAASSDEASSGRAARTGLAGATRAQDSRPKATRQYAAATAAASSMRGRPRPMFRPADDHAEAQLQLGSAMLGPMGRSHQQNAARGILHAGRQPRALLISWKGTMLADHHMVLSCE